MTTRGSAALRIPDYLRELETLPISMPLKTAAEAMCISPRTLQRMIDAGEIRATRRGGKEKGGARLIVMRAEVIRYHIENPAR